ncbi:hypothetical protein AK812_SmicGene5822 [Symbiodinium microadriaticum]|uniref:Uncharacterized protein n=1 Tax=Symbiodinium microadriaticum TaxID=2951 RepID=A0A1Q9EST7_SYMMI|nr:hypothetical protein AK812_SmicGene5822 [Symbiodinium microadriaticum]
MACIAQVPSALGRGQLIHVWESTLQHPAISGLGSDAIGRGNVRRRSRAHADRALDSSAGRAAEAHVDCPIERDFIEVNDGFHWLRKEGTEGGRKEGREEGTEEERRTNARSEAGKGGGGGLLFGGDAR